MEPDDPVPLAELTQAVLDPATLRALVTDLTTLTTILAVTTKGAEQHHGKAAAMSVGQAVESLTRGELRGVQIHYCWQGQEWLDTCGDGIRIVRAPVPTGAR